MADGDKPDGERPHGESPPGAEPPPLEEHEATFNGFLRGAMIVGLVSVAILIFLAFVGT